MFWKDCLVSVVFPLKENITYMEFLLKKKKKKSNANAKNHITIAWKWQNGIVLFVLTILILCS